MIKETFLELLTHYRTGKLSREDFEKNLDELYLSATEQIKDKLDISTIFVSLSLPRLRAAPSERYNAEEIDQLIEALLDRGFVCYQSFYRISEDMLPRRNSRFSPLPEIFYHAMVKECPRNC